MLDGPREITKGPHEGDLRADGMLIVKKHLKICNVNCEDENWIKLTQDNVHQLLIIDH
jgi:hypothetical protein